VENDKKKKENNMKRGKGAFNDLIVSSISDMFPDNV
jgi:hypothetical protein